MRSPRTLYVAAGLLITVGVTLVLTARNQVMSGTGFFVYAPQSDSISIGDSLVLLTTQEVLGWAAGWLATLLIAGRLGYRAALRRRPPPTNEPQARRI